MTACRAHFAARRILRTAACSAYIFGDMKTNRENGFTLYELLITIMVVGVIMALGIPNFSDFTANSRMTATANDLHASFLLARSEAARSKANVTICASADPLAGNATCGGTLASGWIVFQDDNGNVVRDAGEAMLRAYPAPPAGININTVGAGDYFSYAPSGLGRGDVGVGTALRVAVMCDDRGNVFGGGGASTARVVVVTPIGRAAVLREVDQVTAQGGCP